MRYIFHMNIKEKTEDKVFSYMEEQGMTSPGHRIVAGVSGGADSVCLLFVLLEYAKRVPIRLAAVHINHGIREEAGEDAEFVRQLCQQEGVPFFLKEADVSRLAAREKISLEEAGRILRYQAFREAAEEFGADRIAVAHNGNDRAETMLFHLFRGSGIRGLCSIPPKREEIIRPLLCLERSEIENYLAQRGIPYRTDRTNLEDCYTRNRIRHHLIPLAEQEVSPRTVAHMCRTADMLTELEEYLEFQTLQARESCVIGNISDCQEGPVERKTGPQGGPEVLAIDVERFGCLHIAMQKRLLLSLLRELAPGGRDISAVHLEDTLSLFWREGNPQIDLPLGIRAVKRYGTVYLERGRKSDRGTAGLSVSRELGLEGGQSCHREQGPEGGHSCHRKQGPQGSPSDHREQDSQDGILYQELVLPSGETKEPLYIDLGVWGRAEISVFNVKKGQKVLRNEYTKWLDCDKIIESPVFRFRRTGDFLSLADGKGGTIHKSLKDYMITEKIPRELRSQVLVLAEGKHILWLVGYRISEYYKVTENTKRILQVKLIRNCISGGTEEKGGGTH